MQNETKQCQSCKSNFTIEPNDFLFYEKTKVPMPVFCPKCRQQIRIAYRNFKTLYRRPSSKSGKMIISMYNPDVIFPVYDIKEWWGDDWDPISYGKDIEWDKSLMYQFFKLANKIPHVSMMSTKSENCEYSNMVGNSKNCYLVFGCVDSEDCSYGHIVWNSKDSLDNLYLFKSESCYECVDCLNCNDLSYSQECESCAEGIGLFDCRGCVNCIGCTGLINKSYYIYNEQVSKDEYGIFLKYNKISDIENIKKIIEKRNELLKTVPQRSFFGYKNNDVSGNHIYNAHNVHNSFDIKSGENSRYCFTVRKAVDSYDASFTSDISECYQILFSVGNKLIGTHSVIDSHDVYYSDYCYNCDHLFGCFGLRKKSYCVLNKQYTKEEYEVLVPRLIDLMKEHNEFGDFFHKEFSPFAYNESIVNEYMPLSKEEAISQGFKWRDDIPKMVGQETIKISNLPKDPSLYNDELKNEVLSCEKCSHNFRLISSEITFYKKMGLSIPKKCFNCRHQERMRQRNKRILFDANCVKCNSLIKTSYNKEDQVKFRIYCEKCYQEEMI